VQVERKVICQDLAPEDIVQQVFVAPAEDDVMVGQARIDIAAFGAKVDHKQRHAVTRLR
jgi:hypothetical protein